MTKLLPLLVLLSGCAIEKFNAPSAGYASAVVHHARFFGFKVGYSGYSAMLGWGSDTFQVVPVSTNALHTATLSDTFSLGQDFNPLATSIKEDVQTGWTGAAPIPRLKLFPETKPLP